MIDDPLAETRGEQLVAFGRAVLAVEEFDVTLPTHAVGNVTFNPLRLYARSRRISSRRASPP
jgi:hypothetical protein